MCLCLHIRIANSIGVMVAPEELEPKAGIEPATYGLRNRCSTAELLRQNSLATATDKYYTINLRNDIQIHKSRKRIIYRGVVIVEDKKSIRRF
jgi:hypothetical protein